MTQQVFAQFIKISPATLSGIFNGRTNPSLNIVEAIKNSLPSISTDWLLFGNGPMYIDVSKGESAASAGGSAGSQEALLDFEATSSAPPIASQAGGFVQGVNKAAEELGVANDVTVEYVYGGQFHGDQTITATMDGWYKNRGVEVVFACGGGIWTSACEAAAKVGGKVIGVDTDQTALINNYGEGMCVTSAMKGLSATVEAVLDAIKNDGWANFSGKVSSLGLVSGTNLHVNFVGLPTETLCMKNFTVDNYKTLVSEVYSKKITVSNAIDKAPETSVKVNYYQSIK